MQRQIEAIVNAWQIATTIWRPQLTVWVQRKEEGLKETKPKMNHPTGRLKISMDTFMLVWELFSTIRSFFANLAPYQIQMSAAMFPTIKKRLIMDKIIRRRRKSINTSIKVTNTSTNVIRGKTRKMRMKTGSPRRKSQRLRTNFWNLKEERLFCKNS